MQLRLHGLPMDEGGLIPAALDAACRTGISRVLYTMPALHNPTTVSMSEDRRAEIAAIAERYQVAIVEDGVHGLLAAEDRPPLSAFAPDQSYYVTSFSKTIAPGLRIGFLKAPRTAVPRLESAIRATMWMASPLLAEVAAGWIRDGTADTVLEARREEARARQTLAREGLEGFDHDAHATGYHVWLAPPPPWRASELVEAARHEGVLITPADVFVAGRGHVPARVRLCLSSVRDREGLARGLGILRELLASVPAEAIA
jgi:DNA-binding transcriptional MocR family regulator